MGLSYFVKKDVTKVGLVTVRQQDNHFVTRRGTQGDGLKVLNSLGKKRKLATIQHIYATPIGVRRKGKRLSQKGNWVKG